MTTIACDSRPLEVGVVQLLFLHVKIFRYKVRYVDLSL